MKRRITYLAVVAALALGSCAGNKGTPSNQTDACSVLDQQRGWSRDLVQAERKWGVPAHVIMATIWKESSYRSRARTQRKYFLGLVPTGRISSAYGYAQAIDATWDWYRQDTGNRFADRNDFDDSIDFIGWYMDVSNRRLGIAKDDAYNQYLAYHEGHTGYKRGSHNEKSWLIGTAREVESMGRRYESQLETCL
ncbi:MAG TPA: transglycosylase SLT domain-containing protein [Paracoccaceae bacterium]|nr:transglycosylase SLT domain-containing protein [Paracoccaceae bacterium]